MKKSEWEKELDERFDVEYPYIFEERNELKAFIRSQRQDLLKELRGEVEGMKLPTSTRNYITKAEPINKKLQDVIKLLERGNEYD